MVDQLEASVASLRDDLAQAESSGNAKKVAEAKAKLEAQEQWLAQARAGLDEFSG
jgi:PHD/YefM family antitoxin component YafN of YafNO toxin-antitoxin module